MNSIAKASVDPIIEPDLPIVDPHHHIWTAAHGKYDYLIPELNADLQSGHNITHTVYCECKSQFLTEGPPDLRPVGETEFIRQQADVYKGSTKVFAGMVMFADLRLGSRVEDVLAAHGRVAGKRFKGIRNIAAYDPSPLIRSFVQGSGMLAEDKVREGVACLARNGLVFETYVFHPQLSEVAALASAQPNAKIVVNAFGGPLGVGPYKGKRQEVFEQWRPAMSALSAHENVYVHISGFGAKMLGFGFHKADRLPSNEQFASAWRPYVDHCLQAFGAGRCMFASNFPEDRSSISFRQVWNVYKHLCSGLSAGEKHLLFSGTSAKIYNLQ